MKWLFALGLGALGGGVVGVLIWRIADQKLRAEFTAGGGDLAAGLAQGQARLSAEARAARTSALTAVGVAIQQQLPNQVRRQVVEKLTAYGITPVLISEIKSALTTARRLGVIT